jgi:hypothetical protein
MGDSCREYEIVAAERYALLDKGTGLSKELS